MTVASLQLRESPQPHRFTREEYYRMMDFGMFDGVRVELIEGEIIEMAAQKNHHVLGVSLAAQALLRIFADGFWVRTQAPLSLGATSDPEPDVVVVEGDMRIHKEHPKSALLVIEISDTTLRYDRTTKASLYARSGIADYWIVNLTGGCVEVHRDPVRNESSAYGFGYHTLLTLRPGDKVAPLVRPASEILVAELLP